MELYLLEYLVAFRDCGTVEAAAEKLHVTAPTVSRGLKKLEATLGVALLDRAPTKIKLNDTGRFAAERAQDLLARAAAFQVAVCEFDADHAAIRTAAMVPGVLRLFDDYPHVTQPLGHYVDDQEACRLLQDQGIDLAVTAAEHNDGTLESVFLGRDTLVAKMTEINALHDRPSLTFADLAGQEFVLPRAIGLWGQIIEQNAPDTMLIYQDSDAAFRELVRYSNFPIFRTRLTDAAPDTGFHERTTIPISDAAATIELYATYRIADRTKMADAVRHLSTRIKEGQRG